jgi:chemotaxis protein MotB
MDGRRAGLSQHFVFPEPAAHQEIVMFAIIGIVVTFGAVLGGYLMEHGNVRVLMQPAELLIIGGAGAGTVLIANPLHILKQIAAGVGAVFKGSKFTKQRYVDSLRLGYELLNKARRRGLMSLETDVEDPDQSPIFSAGSRCDRRILQRPRGVASKLGTSANGPGERVVVAVSKDDMTKLKEELEKAISQMPNFDKLKNQIEIKITPEGLRIELLESASGTFFNLGNSDPNENGKELLGLLAHELGKLPNKILIEGHTDSKPFNGKRNYGNWELSVDRSNSARRLMQQSGLGDTRIAQVRGFADQLLRKPENPLDPSNRRISRLVQYTDQQDAKEGRTAEAVQKVESSEQK